jgi:mannosyl-oligosaccharide glucosidase
LEDRLKKYGWLHHDGKNFGVQEIHDGNYIIETSFIKFYTNKLGGEWTSRIHVKPKNSTLPSEEIALIWYVALDEKTEGQLAVDYNQLYRIRGEAKGLGNFKVTLHNSSGKQSLSHKFHAFMIL